MDFSQDGRTAGGGAADRLRGHRAFDGGGAVRGLPALSHALGSLDAQATAALISATGDVALFVDGNGVIRDVSVASDDMALDGHRKWIGRAWSETVTVESRPKVTELLSDAAAHRARRWRHLNHPSTKGADIPVLYAAVPVGDDGAVVAIGRDMRPMAALQQRLVDAQQSMERDYLRLRHMETRYRLLFQMGTEPVLIVDATTQRVVEANPAAVQLIDEPGKKLVGRSFTDCFQTRSRAAVTALLGRVPAAGRSDDIEARLAGRAGDVTLSAALFRQDAGSLFLIRLKLPQATAATVQAQSDRGALLRVLEAVPDGFVVTDGEGRILTTNAAFLDMTQLSTPEQLRGVSLDRWLGRSGVDLSVLIANLKQQGTIRLFATTLRGQHGTTTPVEISAAYVPHEEHPCMGFTVRDIGRRLGGGGTPERSALGRSPGDLTKLVGRVPLKDIVGETTDLIEKMCIEAALELTRDNRASAAEMLGLSRQSLYVKLRRHGLGDLGHDDG